MLARSKLNNIERKISEALINNEITHEDFTAIINKEKNYRGLKKSIRMIIQRSNIEKIIWLKKVKEKALMKLLDKMHKYKTMLPHCLKCKKNTGKKSKNLKN